MELVLQLYEVHILKLLLFDKKILSYCHYYVKPTYTQQRGTSTLLQYHTFYELIEDEFGFFFIREDEFGEDI